MLTPYLPYPLLSGGQIRSYNLLKNLSKKHQITLVALIKNDTEKKYIANIQRYCHKVIVAKRPEKPWTFKNIIKTVFGLYPFLVVRNYSDSARKKVIEELDNETFDLIHAETFYVMPHIIKTKIPMILVEQTIEYLVYQHFVNTIKFFPVRWLLSIDVYKIHYWEKHFWQQAKAVIAMSHSDKKKMQENVPRLDVKIVPNGVDCSVFKFNKKNINQTPKLLFVGNFKWLQNREAVIKLVKYIWPIISKKIPQSTLWIVGKFPTAEILALKNKQIIISDNIENINEAYNRSDILIAPIYGPGGTRYKILEAMASGVPVITTSFGIEGLGVSDGIEAIVRDTPEDIAEAAINILRQPKLYSSLAENANKMVRIKYNWATIANQLDKIYEEVAHGKN